MGTKERPPQPATPANRPIDWTTFTNPENLELLKGKQFLVVKNTLTQQAKIVKAETKDGKMIITLDKTLELPGGRSKTFEFSKSTKIEQGGAHMLTIESSDSAHAGMRIAIFPDAELGIPEQK